MWKKIFAIIYFSIILLVVNPVDAEPLNSIIQPIDVGNAINYGVSDPDGLDEAVFKKPDGTLLGGVDPVCGIGSGGFVGILKSQLPAILTMIDCQSPPDVTVWRLTATKITCIAGICPKVAPVGGEFMGVNTTALLLVGIQNTSAWLIPIIVSGIGIGTLLLNQKSKLKNNSCPSCKFETNDTFLLRDELVGSCQNSKCRVSLFLVK